MDHVASGLSVSGSCYNSGQLLINVKYEPQLSHLSKVFFSLTELMNNKQTKNAPVKLARGGSYSQKSYSTKGCRFSHYIKNIGRRYEFL